MIPLIPLMTSQCQCISQSNQSKDAVWKSEFRRASFAVMESRLSFLTICNVNQLQSDDIVD